MTAPKITPSGAFVALTAVYFFVAAATAVQVAVHEVRCSELIERIAEKQNLDSVTQMDVSLNPQLMGKLTAFFLRLTNPRRFNREDAARNQEEIVTQIRRLRVEVTESAEACLALLAFSAFYLLSTPRSAAPDSEFIARRIFSLLAVTLVFFTLGIGLPVLTAVVKGRHMMVGGFIIQAASKGIVSTVRSLFRSGDWVIAVLLTAFSIAIPLFKGVMTGVAVLTRSESRRKTICRYLEWIGKWSLTDVLVAAVLLGCFSLNAISEANGGITAVPRFGFGFFVLYCVLAFRTSHLIGRIGRGQPLRVPAATAILRSALLAGALATGALFSRGILTHFTLGRKAVDVAVVKLVRTHVELLNRKEPLHPGKPAIIPLELPFRGTLKIRIEGAGAATLEVALQSRGPDADDADPAPAPAAPVPEFAALAGGPYERSKVLPAGAYELVIVDRSKDGLLNRAPRPIVHASLDP